MNPQEILKDVPTQLFLGGQWTDGASGETLDVINPADGQVLTSVASADEADARRALDLAAAAQEDWAARPARERSEILVKAFNLCHEHSEKLAYLMSLELGRALPDSRAEVAYSAEFFRWFAEEGVRVRGDYRIAPSGNARIVVTHHAVGPVLAVTPWNFPLAMGTRKLGPALAAGCTVVCKPASKTPLTMLYLGKLLKEAGVPDGVVSILPSKKASNVSAILDDARVRKLTFTGSTEVGQMLAEKAAKHSMKVSLELGGNAPYIVLSDADVATAAKAVAVAKMRGGGQVCIAANRFLVHEDVKEEFVQGVVEEMKAFRMGPGTDEKTTLGPLSGEDQLDKVSSLVDDAKSKGATVLLGGERGLIGENNPEGYFYPATVLSDVSAECDLANEEIFGPVVAVQTFSDDKEAIRMANDTPFGLAAYVFGETGHALAVAEKVEAGMVAVNKGGLSDPAAPFGGVKESGLGREGGFEGIHEFLETQFISLPL